MSVIEAELGLLEMQRELVVSHAMKLRQPMFGIAPERLDAVDVSAALDEFIVAVIDPKVLSQAQINQPIVTSPAIGMDDAVGVHFAADDGLQRGFGGIGDDFDIDTIPPPPQAKDDGFATCATPALAPGRAVIGVDTLRQAHSARTPVRAPPAHSRGVRCPVRQCRGCSVSGRQGWSAGGSVPRCLC